MADAEVVNEIQENLVNQEITNNDDNGEIEQEAEENPNKISQWASEVIAFSSQYNDVNKI